MNNPTYTAEDLICDDCLGEDFVQQKIMQEGEKAKCSICGECSPSIRLETLAGWVHSVLEEHYQLTPTEPTEDEYYIEKYGNWTQSGDAVDVVIEDLLMCDQNLATSIVSYLSDTHDFRGKESLYEPDPYGIDSRYEGLGIDDSDFSESWSDFKYSVKTKSRYLNAEAVGVLDELFDGVASLDAQNNKPVIRELPSGTRIHRGRYFETFNEAKDALQSVPDSIGAPPSTFASAGRMNAAGVSIFYGAFDPDTCVKEVRPAVGGYVLLGEFCTLVPLRVLDFQQLKHAMPKGSGSLFDDIYITNVARSSFLSKLANELSRPIMPSLQTLEYVPTQFVLEYLASQVDLKLDGIMFQSAQSEEGKNPGTSLSEMANEAVNFLEGNVVLFHERSSHLSRKNLYGSELDAWDYSDPDDGQQLMLSETLSVSADEPSISPLVAHTDSLDLDMESLELRKVLGVEISTSSEKIRFHSEVKSDDPEEANGFPDLF